MAAENIRCNLCERALDMENGILKEDALEVTKEWGYFSKKDLMVHSFVICEQCYDKIIEEFRIPVRVSKKNEVL